MTIRDGNWELINHDIRSGRTVWRWFDGEKTHYRTDYPVDATLSENAAWRNEADRAWRGDYHRVASVPLNIFFDRLEEAHSHGDDRYVSKWLNDPDNRAWRTKEGRV